MYAHTRMHGDTHTCVLFRCYVNIQLKQLLSNELPYEEDWEDGSINNSILESVDDSSTVHSNDTSPAPSINTEAFNKVCIIHKKHKFPFILCTAKFLAS